MLIILPFSSLINALFYIIHGLFYIRVRAPHSKPSKEDSWAQQIPNVMSVPPRTHIKELLNKKALALNKRLKKQIDH